MHDSAKFWLWALFILFALWFITGGYNSNLAKGGPFLHSFDVTNSYGSISDFNLIPTGNFSFTGSGSDQIQNAKDSQSIQQQIDRISSEIKKAQDDANASEYKGKITLRAGNTSSTDPKQEYLEMDVASDLSNKILLTGWRIQSRITGRGAAIGKAAPLAFTDQINQEESIFANPGDILYISTGRSPLGISFKVNECTGYFGQFQSYTPSLRTDCPRPINEKHPNIPNNYIDDCEDFLNNMNSCQVQIQPLPPKIGPDCATLIGNKINYQTCIVDHRSDYNFFKPEWRIFLKQDYELWKDRREVIELLDLKGKVVDTITY